MSFAESAARVAWLRTLAATCHTFNDMVTKELYTHMSIDCGTRSRSQMNFVRNVISVSTESEDGSGNGSGNESDSSCSAATTDSTRSIPHDTLKTLRLRYDQAPSELVANRFKSTWDTWPSLEQLWIVGAPLGVTWLTMTSLRDLAPTIVQLCLDNVGLLESESLSLPALSFPHLKHFALSNPIIFPSGRAAEPWQPFLNTTACPQLESIVLSGWVSSVRPEQLESLNRCLCSVASQIKRFTFKPTAGLSMEDLSLVYDRLCNLRFLGVPVSLDTAMVLARLPRRPDTIRFFAHFNPDDEMAEGELFLSEDLVRVCEEARDSSGDENVVSRYILPDVRHMVDGPALVKRHSASNRRITVEFRRLPFDEYAIQWEDLIATGFGLE
ncbi:hypothetical protein OIV83_004434 [Microbotryomycetes sp. JL201]|nr:hypothetical protein OIV83_004434 [Microbotryomycetes sp. JL201]